MKNLITCLVVCVLSGATFAETWTVDDDGKADFDNIQSALYSASDGDVIVVMPGTYTSTQDAYVVNMYGKAVTLRSSDPSEPNVVAATIIDGEGTRRGIACFNDETSSTSISGFTITNGYADSGGGMYNLNSSPTLTNCIFKNNTTSTAHGGGMCNENNSNPNLTNCTFENNTSDENGGGIYNSYSHPTLIDCTFANNISNDRGGGMFNLYCSPTLISCTVNNNTATNDGGGMYNYSSNSMLTGSTLCSNAPNQLVGNWTDEGGNTVTAICPVPGACCTNDNCIVSEQEDCVTFFGQWLGEGTTCENNPCPTSCLGDVTGDGQVNVSDLLAVIAVWGACP